MNYLFCLCILLFSICPLYPVMSPWSYKAAIYVDDLEDSEGSHDVRFIIPAVLSEAIDQRAFPIIVSASAFIEFLRIRYDFRHNVEAQKWISSILQDWNAYLEEYTAFCVDEPSSQHCFDVKKTFKMMMDTNIISWFEGKGLKDYKVMLKAIMSAVAFEDTEWEIYESLDKVWFVLVPRSYIFKKLSEWDTSYQELFEQSYQESIKAYELLTEQKDKDYFRRQLDIQQKQREKLARQQSKKALLLGLALDDELVVHQVTIKELEEKVFLLEKNKKTEIETMLQLFLTKDVGSIGNWIIAFSGHGSPVRLNRQEIMRLTFCESFEQVVKKLQEEYEQGQISNLDLSASFPLEEYRKIVAPSLQNPFTVGMSAHLIEQEFTQIFDKLSKTKETIKTNILQSKKESFIAGFITRDFQKLLYFFSEKVYTQLIAYATCYGGGLHLLHPYIQEITRNSEKELRDIPLNYMLISIATTDASISFVNVWDIILDATNDNIAQFLLNSSWSRLQVEAASSKDRIVLQRIPVSRDLKTFFNQAEHFFEVGSVPQHVDPIKQLVMPLALNYDVKLKKWYNILPSIRYRTSTFFQVPAFNENVALVNYVRLMAKTLDYKQTKQPWVLDKEIILLYPSIIDIPLEITVNAKHAKVVLPKCISMAQGPGLHYVKQIDTPLTLKQFLSCFMKISYAIPKMFVIKKLRVTVDQKPQTYGPVMIYLDENMMNKVIAIQKNKELSKTLFGFDYKDIREFLGIQEGLRQIDEKLHEWAERFQFYQPIVLQLPALRDMPGAKDPHELVKEVKKLLEEKPAKVKQKQAQKKQPKKGTVVPKKLKQPKKRPVPKLPQDDVAAAIKKLQRAFEQLTRALQIS